MQAPYDWSTSAAWSVYPLLACTDSPCLVCIVRSFITDTRLPRLHTIHLMFWCLYRIWVLQVGAHSLHHFLYNHYMVYICTSWDWMHLCCRCAASRIVSSFSVLFVQLISTSNWIQFKRWLSGVAMHRGSSAVPDFSCCLLCVDPVSSDSDFVWLAEFTDMPLRRRIGAATV